MQQALQPGGPVVSGLVVTVSTQKWMNDKQIGREKQGRREQSTC